MREKYNPKKAEDSQFEEEGEGSIGLKEGDFESETDQKDFNFVEARKIESEKINEKVEKFEASHKGLLKKLPKGIKRELATFLLTLSLTTALSDGIAPKKAFAQEREKSQKEKKEDSEELAIKGIQRDLLGEDIEVSIDDDWIKKRIEIFKNSDFGRESFFSKESSEFNNQSSENSNGEVSTKGDNIALRGISIIQVEEIIGSKKEEKFIDNFHTYFELGNLESEVEPTGKSFQAKGVGPTAQEATQDALKNAGETIETLVRVVREKSTSEERKIFTQEYFGYVECSFDQVIESYEVIGVEEIEKGDFNSYQVELKIQPGKIIE